MSTYTTLKLALNIQAVFATTGIISGLIVYTWDYAWWSVDFSMVAIPIAAIALGNAWGRADIVDRVEKEFPT